MEQPLATSAPRLTRASAVLGALGGVALAATEAVTTRGPLVLLPYAATMFASYLLLRRARGVALRDRAAAAFTTFAVASGVLYAYLGVATGGGSIPLLGHAWRLGLLAVVGALASAAIATASE